MKVVNATWTPECNLIHLECECGKRFEHPAYISLCICPKCRTKNIWHGVDPDGYPDEQLKDIPVAELHLENE